MGRALLLCLSLFALSGCATLSYPLPKCDGYAKRPLNRSMWEWESGKQAPSQQHSSLAAGTSPALAFTSKQSGEGVHTAFAGFDEAGSHRACQAG
ncbi:type IV secretion system protein VirB7 [Brucella pituitosa]|uniref:type IV secretion system protein VirB7 n=1 Tax=Brucella pituitosa TaxID=571256 RepID=UPI003CFF5127